MNPWIRRGAQVGLVSAGLLVAAAPVAQASDLESVSGYSADGGYTQPYAGTPSGENTAVAGDGGNGGIGVYNAPGSVNLVNVGFGGSGGDGGDALIRNGAGAGDNNAAGGNGGNGGPGIYNAPGSTNLLNVNVPLPAEAALPGLGRQRWQSALAQR